MQFSLENFGLDYFLAGYPLVDVGKNPRPTRGNIPMVSPKYARTHLEWLLHMGFRSPTTINKYFLRIHKTLVVPL